MELDFSDDVKQKTRKYLRECWSINSRTPKKKREELVGQVAKDMFHYSKYGVEDAILSGKRLRLFPELGEDRGMNCAEVGINTFMFHNLFDKEKTGVLRVVECRGRASHLHALYDTHKERPGISDPLWDLEGRIKIVEKGPTFFPKGYIYYPETWLTVQKAKKDAKDNKVVDENVLTLLAQTVVQGRTPEKYPLLGWEMLTTDEVIRHINYINTPLGFFDYYKSGQKIREKKGKFHDYECTVQSKEDRLILRVVCNGLGIGGFTYERVYHFTGKRMMKKDRKILHHFYEWVSPTGIFYTEDKESQLHRPKLTESQKTLAGTAMLNTSYVRHLVKGDGRIFNEEGQEEYVQECKKIVQKYEETIKEVKEDLLNRFGGFVDHSEKLLNQLIEDDNALFGYFHQLAKGQESLYDILETGKEEALFFDNLVFLHKYIKNTGRRASAIAQWLSYADHVNGEERAHLIDSQLFSDAFDQRKIPAHRPYFAFARGEEPLSVVQEICQRQYERYKPSIDGFFNSQVCETLVEQYKEAVTVKKQVDQLLDK